jgi:hypothetical protein
MIRRINHTQAKALAAYLHTIREDWGIDGCITAIGQARDQGDIESITRWSVAAALNPSNRGPAIIAMPGAHRAAPASAAPERESYDRGHFCGTCGEPEHRCRLKWAGDHEFESVARAAAREESERAADALTWAREAIGEAKAEGPRTPPERERKANPHIEELRDQMTTESDPTPTEASR